MKEIIELFTPISDSAFAFCTTLIWQLIFIGIILRYRDEVSRLLNNLSELNLGAAGAKFRQPESSESERPGGEAENSVIFEISDDFLTKPQISKLIEQSALIQKDEKVVDSLLIFRTSKQHTWLITTNKRLWCILDDKNTRKSRRLIQWKISLESAKSFIRARESTQKAERWVIDIGPKRGWLFSRTLYSPLELENEVTSMLDEAEVNSNK